jgi:hypothetical protein
MIKILNILIYFSLSVFALSQVEAQSIPGVPAVCYCVPTGTCNTTLQVPTSSSSKIN